MVLLALLGIFISAIVLLFVVLVIGGIYQNWKHRKYFHERGVHYMGAGIWRTVQMLLGNLAIVDAELEIYKDSKKGGSRFSGFSDAFTSPAYYITDLDLMRNIYVKDFEHFVDRRKFSSEHSDQLLKKMLINLESDHWKGLRAKLSPTFTTGKIRRMFGIFEKSSGRMCDYIKKVLPANGEFDICEAYSKYAMDVIASCAFGIDSKSFECDPGVLSEFEQMGQRLQFKLKPLLFFKIIVILALPKVADMLGLHALDTVPQEYFRKVITQVMKRRRQNGERQDDFLQLMMDTQEGLLKDEEETLEVMTGGQDGANLFGGGDNASKFKFEDEDIVANCVLFLLGGFDTLLSLVIFSAYQLALEPQVQERLFQEVKQHMDANNGKLTYESVLEMNYLDMFINETLRYFPPAVRTERRCTKDYLIPGTNVVIEKGTVVGMPVLPIHRDPKYFENPEKFDPERFLPQQKNNRHPYAFSPFGHGPRNCIGMRFALTEVKAVIAMLAYNFILEPSSKTDIPMKFQNTSALRPANGMWLRFTARSQ